MADRNAVPATGTASSGRKTYAIDVRVFLAAITTAMAFAFGIGVAFGPVPPMLPEVSDANSNPVITSHRSQVELPPIQDFPIEGETKKSISSRRAPTKHSAEIGRKIDIHERHVNFEQPSYEDLGDGAIKYVNTAKASKLTDSDDGDEHLPAGQHLLVDIKNVEADFLNSEERLANAMVEVVKSAGLTLLSYHCHSLLPAGVSCVGVLLESHISFHTWPEEGVITLDLFTCGSNPLLPAVPELERLFGIPRTKTNSTEVEKIVVKWSHELRGFRNSEERKRNYLDERSDLASMVISPLEISLKEQVVSVNSEYQRIDIWDVLDVDSFPTHEDAIKANLQPGDPRWLTNEVSTPERLLFLDGALQSSSLFEKEYHEAIVHPAMFAHPNPVNVAIVGGGEGATLREVLKHETVETVTMIEIDKMMVEIAQKHLSGMSDCSNIEGSANNCFDDERSTVIYEDGRAWFVQNYGEAATRSPSVSEFDVIIMDALDPQDESDIIKNLYGDDQFLTSLYNSLSDLGIIAIRVGVAPTIHDPKADYGVHSKREKLFKLLEGHKETAAMFVYEEPSAGFIDPHSFLVVCKNSDCRRRWYADSDAIDFQIYERIKQTKNKDPALYYFDGSTQHHYQLPPRAWETVYCRREPMPIECDYRGLDLTKDLFELDVENEDESDFEIKVVTENDDEVTKVYAKTNIPKGSYIMPESLAASFVAKDESIANLKANTEIVGTGTITVIENFLEYVNNYGHESIAKGSGKSYVEIGGTFLIRSSEDKGESNLGRWMPPNFNGKLPPYSPVYERHMESFEVFLVATKDIKEGEELVKHSDLWKEYN